jgi:hypothetical protein
MATPAMAKRWHFNNCKTINKTIDRSPSNKGLKQDKAKCPYCLKEGGLSAMKRWHFDKCKEFQNSSEI